MDGLGSRKFRDPHFVERFRLGSLKEIERLKTLLGEEKIKFTDAAKEPKSGTLSNFTIHYIVDLYIPIKRGTFIEFRSGMFNVSAVG
ncbi:hypothetical protein L1987_37306 [Smallanthus sonchifolius]|uniref:Uncharacterized protein n=1 Tax=Smallanthus sonchifolius TaxID=185202 RepID=A0ACB9HH92_9ASTR|nr:hypothetical protein L1987_37306 [Smallanthus sonchifolius]